MSIPENRIKSRKRAIAYQESIPGFKQQKQVYDFAYRLRNHEKKRRQRENYKERNRERIFRQQYGITINDYDRMFEAQNGLCAICCDPPDNIRLAVDHCHATGQVRGLLCFKCNNGIGNLRDDPAIILAAARYLSNRSTAIPEEAVEA